MIKPVRRVDIDISYVHEDVAPRSSWFHHVQPLPRPTLQLTMWQLQDATSEEAPYWTGQQSTRAQRYHLLYQNG